MRYIRKRIVLMSKDLDVLPGNNKRIAFLDATYLRDLRKKCNQWLEYFTETITDVGQNAFEVACKTSNGKPFVFDDGNMRSLHFDGRTMQSAMWLSAPDELAFGYTRCMMGFLLQNPAPKHILMIGLGGGSLTKFCYKYLPHTRITVVEIDVDIIALRDQFFIPRDDDRLTIIPMDAVAYVEQAAADVDVILLDGFDADGLVSELLSQEFYRACKKILTPSGVLVSNMWGGSQELATTIARINLIFENAVWWARSIDSYNLITFAFASHEHSFSSAQVSFSREVDGLQSLELEKLLARLQTMSDQAYQKARSLTNDHEGLLNIMCQDEIRKKLDNLLVKDSKLARTRLGWMEDQDVPKASINNQNG